MRADDRATVFTIGADGLVVQARGSAEQAAIAVKSIVPTKQQTAFYDSISFAAEHLRKNSPEGRRKVVVVISDGEDTNSKGVLKAIWAAERKIMSNSPTGESLRTLRIKARDDAKFAEQGKVLKSLQNADTVFYSINPAGSSYKLNKMSVFGQSNMEKFASETGGTAFLPKFLPIDLPSGYENTTNLRKNTETLEAIFRQLTNELRAQYLGAVLFRFGLSDRKICHDQCRRGKSSEYQSPRPRRLFCEKLRDNSYEISSREYCVSA